VQPPHVIAIQPLVFVTVSRRPAQKIIKTEFTPAHDAVVAALSDKHHPIIQIGAGPMQLVYTY